MVDSLRGFALMGLFLIHMVEYFELYWYQPDPGIVHDLTFLLFGGKAYAIFALLFGVSFFIQMDNQAKKGIKFEKVFVWRLSLLAIFGYLHGLLYSGDILMVLALAGFLLLFLYKKDDRIVLIIALLFLFQTPLVISIFISPVENQPLHWSLMKQSFDVYALGDFAEVIQQNTFKAQWAKWIFFFETGRIYNVIGLFLMGLFIARKGFFNNVQNYSRACLYIFLVAVAALSFTKLIQLNINIFNLKGLQHWQLSTLLENYQNLALMIIGVLIFVWCYQKLLFNKVLNLLAPCGRMSLTLYVGQSLIGVPLFYHFALSLYSSIGQLNSLLLGMLLWIFQVVFATIWLKLYKFGPLEWCWRMLTYRKFINNRINNDISTNSVTAVKAKGR